MSADQALKKLLLDLFSPDDLRRFLVEGLEAPELLLHLPAETASPQALMGAAVECLRAEGRVDGRFFDVLVEQRPNWLADIRRVESSHGCWGTPAFSAAPGEVRRGVVILGGRPMRWAAFGICFTLPRGWRAQLDGQDGGLRFYSDDSPLVGLLSLLYGFPMPFVRHLVEADQQVTGGGLAAPLHRSAPVARVRDGWLANYEAAGNVGLLRLVEGRPLQFVLLALHGPCEQAEAAQRALHALAASISFENGAWDDLITTWRERLADNWWQAADREKELDSGLVLHTDGAFVFGRRPDERGLFTGILDWVRDQVDDDDGLMDRVVRLHHGQNFHADTGRWFVAALPTGSRLYLVDGRTGATRWMTLTWDGQRVCLAGQAVVCRRIAAGGQA